MCHGWSNFSCSFQHILCKDGIRCSLTIKTITLQTSCRYIYSTRIRNEPDKLFEKLNNYHPNIKLTIEVNPSKLLDREIMIKNGIIEISAVVKESKITNH